MEFQKDTEDQLLEELNSIAIRKGDEWEFRATALNIRAIKVQRQVNEQLVQQTRRLVHATWALFLVAIAAIVVDKWCK